MVLADVSCPARKMVDTCSITCSQVKGAPVVAVSGLTGFGLDRLMEQVVEAHHVWNKRITTNALNRWFEEATNANPPPAVSGRRLKLNYMTQAKTRPPSFVLFCTRADAIPDIYLRYLINKLRERFDLPGTPVRASPAADHPGPARRIPGQRGRLDL